MQHSPNLVHLCSIISTRPCVVAHDTRGSHTNRTLPGQRQCVKNKTISQNMERTPRGTPGDAYGIWYHRGYSLQKMPLAHGEGPRGDFSHSAFDERPVHYVMYLHASKISQRLRQSICRYQQLSATRLAVVDTFEQDRCS